MTKIWTHRGIIWSMGFSTRSVHMTMSWRITAESETIQCHGCSEKSVQMTKVCISGNSGGLSAKSVHTKVTWTQKAMGKSLSVNRFITIISQALLQTLWLLTIYMLSVIKYVWCLLYSFWWQNSLWFIECCVFFVLTIFTVTTVTEWNRKKEPSKKKRKRKRDAGHEDKMH